MSSGSKWTRRLFVIALSSTAAAIAGEIAFRVLYGTPIDERLPLMEVRANPRRGFEMIPRSEHYTYLQHVRVNGLGLRGADVGPKAAGELRVIALGDSLVYGQGVAEEDTIPVRMERALASASTARACRVVNAGVRSYATEQELELLAEIRPSVDPDVVVLFWFANDVEDQRIQATYEHLAASGPVVFDVGERMEGSARWKWRAKQLLRKSAVVMRLHDLWSEAHYPKLAPEALERAYSDLARRLDALAADLALSKIDLLLAVIPVARYLTIEGPTDSTERVRAIAESRAIAFLDVEPALEALVRERGSLPVLAYDGHYTGDANGVIAREVCAALAKRFPLRFAPDK